MLRALTKVAISALLIYLLLRNRDLAALSRRLLAVDQTDLIFAALCYAAVAPPSALRWSIVIGSMGYRLEFRRALLLLLIGYFFNLTIVSSIGGDGVRMWMAHRANLPARVAVSSVIIERLAQLFAHLLILAASVPLLFYRVPDVVMRAGSVLLVGFGALGFAALLTLDQLPSALSKFRAIRTLTQFAQDLRHVLLAPRIAAPTILLGFVNQIAIIAVVAILAARTSPANQLCRLPYYCSRSPPPYRTACHDLRLGLTGRCICRGFWLFGRWQQQRDHVVNPSSDC